jgi:hypothetical protein
VRPPQDDGNDAHGYDSMTLVAHFRSFGIPTLIGDLLISGSNNPGQPVHIPASRNINERIFSSGRSYIAGLSQKLVLVNSGLAIAWSGSYEQASELFSMLEPLKGLPNTTVDYFKNVIDAIDDRRKNDLALIALVATANAAELVTHRTRPPVDFEQIAQVVCAGSGRDIFLGIVEQHSSNLTVANPNANLEDLRNSFDWNLVSTLSGEEFSSTIPLQRGWGGGFEIIRFEEGSFRKIGPQLALNFCLDREAEGWSLRWVPNFRHTDHWRDTTIVQAVEHEVDTHRALMPGRRDVFVVVPPGAAHPSLSDFSPPDIQVYDVVLSYILVPDPQNRSPYAVALTYAAAYTQPVMRYDAPSGTANVRVAFDTMFIDDILAFLRPRFHGQLSFGGARNRPG